MDKLLPEAEFQYNNHIHASMQVLPFFLDTGQHPWMSFEPCTWRSENESVNKLVDRMQKAQEEAKAVLTKVKDDMAQYYNQGQTPAPKYKSGDHVFLDVSNISTT